MLLAQLEIFHSRPIAPTRRICLGRSWLPGPGQEPGPGLGGLLLGAVCARFGSRLSDELMADVVGLTHEVEQGCSVAQPRLRHRLQHDRVGLTRSRQRLCRGGPDHDDLVCEFDSSRATASQLVLGAVYAAGLIAPTRRGEVMRSVRLGLAWRGEIGAALFSFLAADARSRESAQQAADPVGWALETLGLRPGVELPQEAAVRQGFRDALRAVHPDLGAADADAAARIADLSEARRILLAR